MKIYRSCNPSKFIRHEEMHGMLKVTMSCGGGMGGSRWEEYIREPFEGELEGDSPVWVTNYLGEEVLLNPRFVVKATRLSITKVVEDITAWMRRSDGKQYLKTTYFEISPCESVALIDEYNFDANKDANIKSITTSRTKY